MGNRLKLSEKLFLLAIHPVKGGLLSYVINSLNHSLVGAFILEMVQDKKISIKNRYVVIHPFTSKDSVHNHIQLVFKKHSKLKKMRWWFNKLNFSIGRMKRFLKNDLKHKNVIRLEQKKFLFF